jgi:hypothetical protein
MLLGAAHLDAAQSEFSRLVHFHFGEGTAIGHSACCSAWRTRQELPWLAQR